MKQHNGGRSLKTTETSLEVLEAVIDHGGASISTLVDELGLSRSTVHNHVSTLVDHGYLTEDANTYYAGAKFCQIGDHVRKCKPEYVIAGDIVADLAERTELDVDFSVEENGYIISLYNGLRWADNAHFLNSGSFFYVHSTASGKAILAEYTTDHAEQILEKRGLPELTRHTITSKEAFFEELERVREQGYAVNEEESLEGMWSVAKTVHNPMGKVIGTVNLSAPLYLRDPDVQGPAVELLTESVERFEERLEQKFLEG
ncbi:IclR family transcriptional regulator [Haloarchaeobius sp. HME9146]|uniref:IclR family transcriptional regulator n=1 Tax=Haloarchaeobius sp. HME9146 TaxID=2978732 RepID=UPI0021C13AB2|nr:IclR family transcriptional regulator [Haloarchaeobius sp. HME9146]MCT9098093.1 IclR family transcriptional regulator [Haloarchaeobius sp. HME9146]